MGSCNRFCILFLAAAALAALPGSAVVRSASAAGAVSPRLSRIVIEGLEDAQHASEIRRLVALEPGDPLDREVLDGLERRLERKGLRPSRMGLKQSPLTEALKERQGDEVDLVLDFSNRVRIQKIEVFPLFPLDVTGLASAGPLREHGFFDAEEASEHVRAIGEAVRERADRIARTSYFVRPLTSSTLALGFVIEPADPPARLGRLRLTGTGWKDLLNRSNLAKNLREQESIAFDEGTSVTAQRLMEVADISALYYRELGYLDAAVLLEETAPEADGESVDVTYRIDRGGRWKVGETRVTGVRHVEAAGLREIAGDMTGKHLTAERCREIGERLERRCMAEGFMAAQASLRLGALQRPNEVLAHFEIDEGTTSTLGEVRVVRRPMEIPRWNPDGAFAKFRAWSAPPLSEEVMRRQVRTERGDPLNLAAVELPASSLRSFGSIEDVKVETEATTDPAVRDVVIDVRDRRSGSFELTGGWAPEQRAMGTFRIQEDNVAGLGDRLAFDIGGSSDRLVFTASYLDRNWIFGERFLGAKRLPSLEHRLYVGERSTREYSQAVKGVDWLLSYGRLDAESLWRDAWRLRFEGVSYDPYRARDAYEEDFDDHLTASLTYRAYRDSRDRAQLSTDGSYFGTALEAGWAGGALLQSTTRYERYETFFKRLTWAMSGEFGLSPFPADEVGIGERFQAGGLHDLRGFRERGIGPVDGRVSGLHTGGSTKLTLSNELRYAVTDNIIPLVFCDAGSLGDDPLVLDRWNASVGAGMRFVLPSFNNEVFFFYSHNLLAHDTDDVDNFQFGFQFALN